jgi:cytochrome P450
MATAAFPAGPKGTPLFGSAFAFRRNPLKFLLELAGEYGDIAHFRAGKYDIVVLSHPDLVKEMLVTQNRSVVQGRGHMRAKAFLGEGLLTSEGDFHRRQRRLVQPAFHKQRIATYAAAMVEHAARARDEWRDGQTVDVADEMMELTLAIVGTTLFSADVKSEAHDIGEAITVFMEWWRTLMLPFSELFDRLPLPGRRRFEQARARMDQTIFRIIEERRACGEDRGDLLSMLLMAQDVEGDGSGMTDEQLRDEAVTLVIAGHETTANGLMWTWYLLAEHPEVEAKLHAELDEVLGGRPPTFEDIPRLQYTERVFTESMRRYPPAWAIGRRAVADFKAGAYTIPAGSLLFVSPYVNHHDPRWFPEPFRFDPDRWTPEMKASLPKFAYFPFGGGPRQCIGEPFAWMEAILLIATIAQQWRLRLVAGHRVEPFPFITLRPKYGMRMTLERRHTSGQ